MTTNWTPDELRRIGAAEELQIAPADAGGRLRAPTTIWVVPDGEDVYVRAVNGPDAAWYRGTRERHEGHIEAEGLERDVAFDDVPDADPVNDRLDAAYRSKYRRYGAKYVDMLLTPPARAATLRLTPR